MMYDINRLGDYAENLFVPNNKLVLTVKCFSDFKLISNHLPVLIASSRRLVSWSAARKMASEKIGEMRGERKRV